MTFRQSEDPCSVGRELRREVSAAGDADQTDRLFDAFQELREFGFVQKDVRTDRSVPHDEIRERLRQLYQAEIHRVVAGLRFDENLDEARVWWVRPERLSSSDSVRGDARMRSQPSLEPPDAGERHGKQQRDANGCLQFVAAAHGRFQFAQQRIPSPLSGRREREGVLGRGFVWFVVRVRHLHPIEVSKSVAEPILGRVPQPGDDSLDSSMGRVARQAERASDLLECLAESETAVQELLLQIFQASQFRP